MWAGAGREGEVSGVESVSATRAADVAERDAACVGRERGECDVEDDGDENVFGEPIPSVLVYAVAALIALCPDIVNDRSCPPCPCICLCGASGRRIRCAYLCSAGMNECVRDTHLLGLASKLDADAEVIGVSGAPPSLLRGDSATAAKEPMPLEGANSAKGPELITLALTTLHTFDFSGM